MSSTLPFPFVFAFKETSGWLEVSWRRRGKKWRHYMVVCASGGVLLWHWNTKPCTQAKQMPWQRWWLCWKIESHVLKRVFSLNFINKYFKKILCLYLYSLDILCISVIVTGCKITFETPKPIFTQVFTVIYNWPLH
jgi:hypothetical protein